MNDSSAGMALSREAVGGVLAELVRLRLSGEERWWDPLEADDSKHQTLERWLERVVVSPACFADHEDLLRGLVEGFDVEYRDRWSTGDRRLEAAVDHFLIDGVRPINSEHAAMLALDLPTLRWMTECVDDFLDDPESQRHDFWLGIATNVGRELLVEDGADIEESHRRFLDRLIEKGVIEPDDTPEDPAESPTETQSSEPAMALSGTLGAGDVRFKDVTIQPADWEVSGDPNDPLLKAAIGQPLVLRPIASERAMQIGLTFEVVSPADWPTPDVDVTVRFLDSNGRPVGESARPCEVIRSWDGDLRELAGERISFSITTSKSSASAELVLVPLGTY